MSGLQVWVGWLVLHCAGDRGLPAGAGLSSAQEDEPWSSIQKFLSVSMWPKRVTLRRWRHCRFEPRRRGFADLQAGSWAARKRRPAGPRSIVTPGAMSRAVPSRTVAAGGDFWTRMAGKSGGPGSCDGPPGPTTALARYLLRRTHLDVGGRPGEHARGHQFSGRWRRDGRSHRPCGGRRDGGGPQLPAVTAGALPGVQPTPTRQADVYRRRHTRASTAGRRCGTAGAAAMWAMLANARGRPATGDGSFAAALSGD